MLSHSMTQLLVFVNIFVAMHILRKQEGNFPGMAGLPICAIIAVFRLKTRQFLRFVQFSNGGLQFASGRPSFSKDAGNCFPPLRLPF